MKRSAQLAMAGLALATFALPAAPAALADEVPARPSGDLSTKDYRITLAMLDLAKREGIHISDISVVKHQEGKWSDGSSGCPQEGWMYTQALVSGRNLVLEANGTTYHYPNYGYCSTPGGAFHPGH